MALSGVSGNKELKRNKYRLLGRFQEWKDKTWGKFLFRSCNSSFFILLQAVKPLRCELLETLIKKKRMTTLYCRFVSPVKGDGNL